MWPGLSGLPWHSKILHGSPRKAEQLALFPYDEIQRCYAYLYGLQSDFEKTAEESATALQIANTMFYRSAANRFDYSHSFNVPEFAGEDGLAVAHQAFEDQSPGTDKLNSLHAGSNRSPEQTLQEANFFRTST